MTSVFADSFYFFALLSERDAAHQEALTWSEAYSGQLLTTEWVLVELGDGLASSRQRAVFPAFYRSLHANPNVRVIGWDPTLFEEGLALYEARSDKEWSLTDCVSFVLMRREGIFEALTGDHHFEQAGFRALFRP